MSVDMKKMMRVTNRSSSLAVYRIPELNIRRTFMPGESKNITYEELVQLTYQPGGRRLMQDILQIVEADVTKELNVRTEPEYYMSAEDVKKLLLSGSLDEFLDALDFAPAGVIDLIKTYAVELPVTDTRKREAILKATGFDVTRAIENNMPDADEEPAEQAAAPTRRVAKNTEPSGRRTDGQKYVVVSKPEE